MSRRRFKKTDSRYVYYENHHIVPKCAGGTNDKCNLVLLLPEEHYVAHQLLTKIYPGNAGLVYALVKMSGRHYGRNNKLYGWIKKQNNLLRSAAMKNKPWSLNRRQASEDNPVVMSAESNLLRRTALTGRKTSSGNLGHTQSTETKLKKKISNQTTIAAWFMSPTGTEVLCLGINSFSKTNGLNVGAVRTLINNTEKVYQGWKFLRNATQEERGT
jgi:hypothetical protein